MESKTRKLVFLLDRKNIGSVDTMFSYTIASLLKRVLKMEALWPGGGGGGGTSK